MIVRLLSVIAVLSCLFATGQAQVAPGDIPCSARAEGQPPEAQIACLEAKIRGLEDANRAYRDQVLRVLEAMKSTVDRLDQISPRPPFILFDGFVRATRGYWSGGREFADRECSAMPRVREGYREVRREDLRRVGGRGTCQVGPFCDSAGEFCSDFVVSALCHIRNDVYDYMIKTAAFSEDEVLRLFCR